MMGVFSHTGCNEALNSLHNKVKKSVKGLMFSVEEIDLGKK
jgi:hypothetical protein